LLDELWVSDITEHPTREGKVYCCCVLDTCSRRIVGWSIDSVQDTTFVVNALDMAIKQRRVKKGSVVHSDRLSPPSSPPGPSPNGSATPA
jgi:transposase InsO family protein